MISLYGVDSPLPQPLQARTAAMITTNVPSASFARLMFPPPLPLHVLDDRLTELRTLQLSHSRLPLLLHQPRKIVGDGLRRNRSAHSLEDQIGRFIPPHVAEHHVSGQ